MKPAITLTVFIFLWAMGIAVGGAARAQIQPTATPSIPVTLLPAPSPTLTVEGTVIATVDPLATPTPISFFATSTPLITATGDVGGVPTNAPPTFAGPFSSGDGTRARVDTESLNVRALPSPESEAIGSLFSGEIVEVISRSLDASWFEVRRIGRMSNLGWVLNDYLEWDFAPETLPLGDLSTGLLPNANAPLASAPPLAVYLEEAPILRELPLRAGRRIMALPPLIVVPVTGRNADASYLQVNYFGVQGWISRTTVRPRPDVDWLTLVVPPGTPPPDGVAALIIPIELQQAQIDRLRAFITDRRGLARGLESFWWGVYRGEVMPCEAPPEVTVYPYGDNDVRELPELGRYAPRLVTAIEYLQAARAPFDTCGVVGPDLTIRARNSAINAGVIFDATLGALENLETQIYGSR